jgi:hypothetical protein
MAELYGYLQAQSPRPREVVHGLPAASIDAFSLLYPADVRRRQNIQGAPRLRASSRCRVRPRGNRPPMRRQLDDGGSCARSMLSRSSILRTSGDGRTFKELHGCGRRADVVSTRAETDPQCAACLMTVGVARDPHGIASIIQVVRR